MKVKSKKMLSLCLALVMALTLSAIPVSAEDSMPVLQAKESDQAPQAEGYTGEGIELYWLVLGSADAYISMSNGTATFIVDVTGYSSCTSFKVTATIQKSNWWWWDDVKSFSKTYSGSSGTYKDSFYVGSGTYRVKANVITYQNGVEKDNVTVYS